MKPNDLKTRIFLDGGNQADTKEIKAALGFLDGQTTNPSLVAKNPAIAERLQKGERFQPDELLNFYRQVVNDVAAEIPDGSVSIEVYCDASTTTEEMLRQGREMYTWIPNAHIKFPTTERGLAAAEEAVKEGMRVNLTLCFSQAQAAGVYAATRGAAKGDVFVSPFVGRLDDRGENGMEVVKNIKQMYDGGDGHVEILSASIRSLDHLLYSLQLGADIITAPMAILKDWADSGLRLPEAGFTYDPGDLTPIPYHDLSLDRDWREFDLHHDLTDTGLEKFSEDWNNLLA